MLEFAIELNNKNTMLDSSARSCGMVELSELEISFVDGGMCWDDVARSAYVGLISGGIGGACGGAAVGAMAGGVGAAPGAFAGFVGGAIGGAVTGAVVSIMDQTLN